MGTRNYTSVILGGKQVVCQYCQWDGYPTGAGADILTFLKGCDLEKLKAALGNTKLITTTYEESYTYTGSPNNVEALYRKAWDVQCELNANRGPGEPYLGTYETVKHMLATGMLSEKEADDFIVSTRDTGCHILEYIYDRDLSRPVLDLFANKEEFEEIERFALDPRHREVPGCDAQGYYIINLDTNSLYINFDNYSHSVDLAHLPEDVDREMFALEESINAMKEWFYSDAYVGPSSLQNCNLKALVDELAGKAVAEASNPERYSDVSNEDKQFYGHFAKKYIFRSLQARREPEKAPLDSVIQVASEIQKQTEGDKGPEKVVVPEI